MTENHSWNLFIDDERNPIDVKWGSYEEIYNYTHSDWIIARNWDETFEYITTMGIPNVISFDHDLGENQKTGYDITKKLVEFAIDDPNNYSFPSDFKYLIHSKNPVGEKNIRMYLQGFFLSGHNNS